MFDLVGLEGEYLRVRADEAALAEAVGDLRRGRWDGLNITMPLKSAAARLADSLSSRASRSGSVNTLFRSDSHIHGDSTDSTAFQELFNGRFSSMDSILVLGAGGSAAAALAARPANADVYVTSRRPDGAERLVARLGGEVWGWEAPLPGALVVNTTPLGMASETLPTGTLDVADGLIDLPYSRTVTPAVATASQRGIPHADGHEFLLRQAIASFSLWTGATLHFNDVADALRNV